MRRRPPASPAQGGRRPRKNATPVAAAPGVLRLPFLLVVQQRRQPSAAGGGRDGRLGVPAAARAAQLLAAGRVRAGAGRVGAASVVAHLGRQTQPRQHARAVDGGAVRRDGRLARLRQQQQQQQQ
jgi:hypothetical protein